MQANVHLVRSVVCPGQALQVHVTFSNRGGARHSNVLAWASVQVLGQVITDASWIKELAPGVDADAAHGAAGAAAGGNAATAVTTASSGHVKPRGAIGDFAQSLLRSRTHQDRVELLFASKPAILVADVTLDPGQSVTYRYQAVVPSDLPPSYRGTAVHYTYALALASQVGTQSAKLFRVPFRVVNPLGGLARIHVRRARDHFNFRVQHSELQQTHGNSGDPPGDAVGSGSQWSPFQSQFRTHSSLQSFLQIHQKSKTFNINGEAGHVARLTLNKGVYHLAETVSGMLDFSQTKLVCASFQARLVVTEHLARAAMVPARTNTPAPTTVVSRCSQLCTHSTACGFSFYLPSHLCTEFETDLVSSSWSIVFTFVLGFPRNDGDPRKPIRHADKPQWLEWTLALRVLASLPLPVERQDYSASLE